MATRWETFPIPLQGGLTTNLGRIEQGIQAPGSATILQNFEPDVAGGYTRILGFNKFVEAGVPGTGLIKGVFLLNRVEAVAERAGKFYYTDGTTWTEKLTLLDPVIARVRKDRYNFSGSEHHVVIDGVNPPAYFNHTTKLMSYAVGAPADVIGANRVSVFKSHIFFAKGRLLSFSAPYLDQDFTPANGAGVINVGDEITGLTVFRDQLIIFCLNSIHRLSGSTLSDFALSPIARNTGCLCGDTIQEVGGDIMYLASDGVRYLSASERENDFGLTRASDKVQKAVLRITNTNCLYSSFTISSKNQYRLFSYLDDVETANSRGFLATKFSNQTVDDISWATLKGFKVYTADKSQERDTEIIIFSSSTDYVYRMEASNSLDGEDIEAIFETPYIPINDPKIRKTFYKHTIYAKPTGGMEIQGLLKFDYQSAGALQTPPFNISGNTSVATYGDTDTQYGSAVYGTVGEEEHFNNVVGSGFVVAIRYSNTSQLPPFNLNFVVLEYRTNERR